MSGRIPARCVWDVHQSWLGRPVTVTFTKQVLLMHIRVSQLQWVQTIRWAYWIWKFVHCLATASFALFGTKLRRRILSSKKVRPQRSTVLLQSTTVFTRSFWDASRRREYSHIETFVQVADETLDHRVHYCKRNVLYNSRLLILPIVNVLIAIWTKWGVSSFLARQSLQVQAIDYYLTMTTYQ